MLFRITTTQGDGALQKYIPLFNLSRKVVWRGTHPNRYEDACWTLDVKTIEELVEFAKNTKCELAVDDTGAFELPEIEIINDYRE